MSVVAAKGFVAAGLHCGVKRRRPDLMLLATADGRPVPTAAVFTTNQFAAPPVRYCQAALAASGGMAAAVVVNSGNANAGTGEKGLADAAAMARAAEAAAGCEAGAALVCSTGPIGQPLPIAAILTGIARAGEHLSEQGGEAAARAILTTDKRPKQALVQGDGFVVGGMAKGCGMIAPNMATMLAFLTTDAATSSAVLRRVLAEAVADTFNCLDVDGATSTNDTAILMASGRAGPTNEAALAAAVRAVCETLARRMAEDAEGATKVVRVRVVGATSAAAAREAARRICRNPLIKCSWHGEDPYWGRILGEAGAALTDFESATASVAYGGVTVASGGVGVPHDVAAVRAHMAGRDIDLELDLGLGLGRAEMIGVDLGPGYITENTATS